MSLWTCECGNVNTRKTCIGCGTKRPESSGSSPAPGRPRPCWYDGTALDAQGFCSRGGGFPFGLSYPWSCPICRRTLEWDGACLSCHGSTTPADRRTWSFPGDRYERWDDQGRPIGDGQHWVKVLVAPRAACTPEVNQAESAMLARVLGAFDARTEEIRV